MKLFWILTIIGVAIGGYIAIFGIMNAKGAPQEAAAAAMGLAAAAIPYILARAVQELEKKK